MKRIVSMFVNWFESGELAPLIILVSVPHYAQVLARYDFGPVAAVLGFLLDLSHYRTIKAYQNGRGALWMVVLTVFSFGFHFAFYWLGGGGWWSLFLGAAVPVVIFALSYLSFTERWGQKARKSAESLTVSRPEQETLPGNLPEVAGMLDKPAEMPKSWRHLTETERQEAAELTTAEIIARWHVSERTARNWRNH